MSRSRSTRAAAVVAAALLSLGIAACSGDSDEATTETGETSSTTAVTDSETETEAASESDTEAEAEDEAASAAGEGPEWAVPPRQPDGELLTTIEGDGFEVEVYQIGTATSPDDGSFVDPETNEPILKAGDQIVFVNYVITNTGDEAIPLAYNLVAVDAEYADWPWLQGMDGTTDRDLYEEMGIDSAALVPGVDEPPFVWEPGATFAYGTNFEYQPGSPITFTARLTPADDAGDLDHDRAQEVTAEATIA